MQRTKTNIGLAKKNKLYSSYINISINKHFVMEKVEHEIFQAV